MIELTPARLDPLKDPAYFMSPWISMGTTAPWEVHDINPIMITYWAFLLKLHFQQKGHCYLLKMHVKKLMQSCKMQDSGADGFTQQCFAKMDKSDFCWTVMLQKSAQDI